MFGKLYGLFFQKVYVYSVFDPAFFRRNLIINESARTAKTGIQIQIISLKITLKPLSLKNPRPIGETLIGRHGKKNLSFVNGAKIAAPEPPFVSISRSGCETVASEKNAMSFGKEISVFKNL